MKKNLALFVCVMLSLVTHAQDLKQNVRGTIADRNSGAPLAGAYVKIVRAQDSTVVQSDEQGQYKATVAVGRYQLTASFTGFETSTQELLVIAGHESVVSITMTPGTTMLDEVAVTDQSLVDRNVPGLRSLSIEKTLRTAANYLDPVRAVTVYPGVQTTNDQGNAIVVHGNSPNGLLWRLNGLDIVNPNHLANAGTFSDKPNSNGGGVNILSAQMLDRTNFYFGAQPANYGNALAGVIDMGLREGNKNDYEYTAQASLIGLDFAAEGPITKGKNSFLANYRYSTVGLLSGMGVDFGGEAITFQDFSFSTDFTLKHGGKIKVFGLYGASKNDFNAKDSLEREEDKDWFDIHYKATTYAAGLTYEKTFKNEGKFSAGISYSSSDQRRTSSVYPTQETVMNKSRLEATKEMTSVYLRYVKQIGAQTILETGVNGNMTYDWRDEFERSMYEAFNECTDCVVALTGESNGILVQPYLSLRTTFSEKTGLTAGFRYVSHTNNIKSADRTVTSTAAEPRLSFYFNPTKKSSFDIAYGLVSQVQSPVLYFNTGNYNLGLTKAHHVNFSYRQVLAQHLKLTTLLYYQRLFDVPVSKNPGSTFSALNLLEDSAEAFLTQEGKGQNYGVDVLVEKSFYGQHYFTIGGSIYQSTFTLADGREFDTRFNGKYMFSGMYGKEWTKLSKNRTIGLNVRALYLGGMYQRPIDEAASQGVSETEYVTGSAYTEKLKDYFRMDLRLSFRKNKPGYTRTFAIDLQNLAGTQNEAYRYYDFSRKEVVTKYQLGIIPVLVYRIDF